MFEVVDEKKGYTYKIKNHEKDGMRWSHYLIEKDGTMIFQFQTPEPFGIAHPSGTDVFLKYQNKAGDVTYNIFKILVGQRKDVTPVYNHPVPADLDYLITDNQRDGVYIFIKGTNHQIGYVGLGEKDMSINLAENFLRIFEGAELSCPWTEIECTV